MREGRGGESWTLGDLGGRLRLVFLHRAHIGLICLSTLCVTYVYYHTAGVMP